MCEMSSSGELAVVPDDDTFNENTLWENRAMVKRCARTLDLSFVLKH